MTLAFLGYSVQALWCPSSQRRLHYFVIWSVSDEDYSRNATKSDKSVFITTYDVATQLNEEWDSRGRDSDRMVVGFIYTYAINAYRQ